MASSSQAAAGTGAGVGGEGGSWSARSAWALEARASANPCGPVRIRRASSRARLASTVSSTWGRLNPALSNGPLATKRQLLDAHTVLHINKDLLANYGGDVWDESMIRKRSAALVQRAETIWPASPSSMSV